MRLIKLHIKTAAGFSRVNGYPFCGAGIADE